MTDQAKQIQREYIRKWRANNPDKQREYNRRYWEKKAKEAQRQNEKSG